MSALPDPRARRGSSPRREGVEWICAARMRRRCCVIAGVRSAHTYQASWYNNATFVFPLIAVIVAGIVWLTTGSTEAGGAAIFFLVVTGAMLPVVFITWQRQTTAVIVHEDGVTALHAGLEQQTIEWDDLRSVRRVETMGNVRWYLDGTGEDHIVIEGEIADRDLLLDEARAEFERRNG